MKHLHPNHALVLAEYMKANNPNTMLMKIIPFTIMTLMFDGIEVKCNLFHEY